MSLTEPRHSLTPVLPQREQGRRVVTVPPDVVGGAAVDFALRARAAGADLLEVRTDLHAPRSVDIEGLEAVMPLLVSERGAAVPEAWSAAAWRVDRDVTALGPGAVDFDRLLVSHHAAGPLDTEAALALWAAVPAGSWVKHVEPLGPPTRARLDALLALQARLAARFGAERVTVLAMGALALPFRAVLAARNALDYVALGSGWSAAPGQRLLADVVREARAPAGATSRLGILGTAIAHSRSPRIHRQPFDRIDLPADAPVGALLDALHPYYRGFAVTSPFKLPAARAVGCDLEAVNTLVRRGAGWEAFNTDVDGARVTLERLGARDAFVLGDGGTTAALRRVPGARLTVLRRADVAGPLSGAGVWTWPDGVAPPEALRFERARVAVIAYGAPGRRIAAEIARRGGTPVRLGAAWFVAQARRQRELWETAT